MNKSEKNETKKWIIREDKSEEAKATVAEIASGLGIEPVIASLLYNRGYRTPGEANAFLRMERELLCDPFLLDGTKEAVARIRRAVESGERITVYGDYDVDGVTAVCTLCLYLASQGAKVDYYIPDRSGEGYGVSRSAVQALAERGTTLIITVDTGVTAVCEIAYAAELSIDVVVTDHHECLPELPPAVAVLDPHRADGHYPFCDLAGVGVVFKLICAYEETVSGDSRYDCVSRICDRYADLVAIGTIADVMPIRSENRLIVSYGLSLLDSRPRLGFAALCEAVASTRSEPAGKKKKTKINSGFIVYTIAPRVNAAGRVRNASLAVELFLTDDPERAAGLAAELCEANRERQAEENRIMEEAYARIEREHDFAADPVIVLAADEWHHGVIGIVSSRITDRYGLPSVLVSFEGCDPAAHSPADIGKGSGRSIKGLNLVDALLYAQDTLVKFGGHELAAGFSVTRGNLPAFRQKINEYARARLSDEARIPTLEADCELSLPAITMSLAEELNLLEPYGVENPVPAFVLRDARVLEIVPVGGGKHTRLLLGDERYALTAMYFSVSTAELNIFPGDCVDVLFNLDINEWAGRRSLQLIVRDLRLSEKVTRQAGEERALYESIRGGAAFTAEDDLLPCREDFAAVYTFIRRSVRSGNDLLTHRAILSGVSDDSGRIGYVKLKFIIRIFQELNLLGIEEPEEEVYRFRLQFSGVRTDLEKSNILRRLRSQMKQA